MIILQEQYIEEMKHEEERLSKQTTPMVSRKPSDVSGMTKAPSLNGKFFKDFNSYNKSFLHRCIYYIFLGAILKMCNMTNLSIIESFSRLILRFTIDVIKVLTMNFCFRLSFVVWMIYFGSGSDLELSFPFSHFEISNKFIHKSAL